MKGFCSRGALLSLAVSLGAHAADVRLVTGDDYAPLTDRALPRGGMLSAVALAALERSGLASSLAWQPWDRGYLMTLRGEYDATFPYIRAEQREHDFLYSAPLYVSEQHLFSRATDSVEVNDLAGVSGRRLCHPLGWQLPAGVQTLVDRGVLVRHSPPSLSECALLLLLGRDGGADQQPAVGNQEHRHGNMQQAVPVCLHLADGIQRSIICDRRDARLSKGG